MSQNRTREDALSSPGESLGSPKKSNFLQKGAAAAVLSLAALSSPAKADVVTLDLNQISFLNTLKTSPTSQIWLGGLQNAGNIREISTFTGVIYSAVDSTALPVTGSLAPLATFLSGTQDFRFEIQDLDGTILNFSIDIINSVKYNDTGYLLFDRNGSGTSLSDDGDNGTRFGNFIAGITLDNNNLTPNNPVPEPGSLALGGAALAALALSRRRQNSGDTQEKTPRV